MTTEYVKGTLPHDIARCLGDGCVQRNNCKRYVAREDTGIRTPWMNAPSQWPCALALPIKPVWTQYRPSTAIEALQLESHSAASDRLAEKLAALKK